jgi:hypothetical protein
MLLAKRSVFMNIHSSLQFSFFKSKKHIRIHVARKKPVFDSKGRVKYVQESIGGFKFDPDGIPMDILDHALTPQEKIEIRHFLYTAQFAKKYFNVDVDNLEREIIRLPAPLLEATRELAIVAHKNKIAFNVHQIFIEALLPKLHELENKLTKKHGYKGQILKKYGLTQ